MAWGKGNKDNAADENAATSAGTDGDDHPRTRRRAVPELDHVGGPARLQRRHPLLEGHVPDVDLWAPTRPVSIRTCRSAVTAITGGGRRERGPETRAAAVRQRADVRDGLGVAGHAL